MVLSTPLFRQSLPLLPPDRCRCLVALRGSRELSRSRYIVKVCFRPVSQAQPHSFDIRQAPTVGACNAGTIPCSATAASFWYLWQSVLSCRCIAKSCIGSILTLVCLVGNVQAEATQQIIEGSARVVDGDTLEVRLLLFWSHSYGVTVRHTQLHRKCHPCRCLESASAYLVWTPQRRPNHAVTRMAGPTPVVRVIAHASFAVNN